MLKNTSSDELEFWGELTNLNLGSFILGLTQVRSLFLFTLPERLPSGLTGLFLF